MRERVIGPARPLVRPFLVPAGCGVAVLVLLAAGRGDLAAPPLGDLDGWVEAVGPVVAAVACLRLAALGAAAWLLLLTLVGAAAGALGATAVAGAAERALPPTLRRVLATVAGAGAAGVVVLAAPGGSATGSSAAPPALDAVVERLVRVPDPPAEPAPVETMSVLDGTPAAPGAPTADPETWTVQPGESFWSIAEELLAERLGRPPTDAEVDPTWRRLVAANLDRLVTGDPDLLFPGQELLLPS